MEPADTQADRASWRRFAAWMLLGGALGLVVVIFVTLALAVPVVVGVVALLRPGRRTALGGYLAGLAMPIAYVGAWIGAVDRTCNAGSIDSAGVETCTQWVPAGAIRWPWFLAAGVLLVVGLALQWWARRDARSARLVEESVPGTWLSEA